MDSAFIGSDITVLIEHRTKVLTILCCFTMTRQVVIDPVDLDPISDMTGHHQAVTPTRADVYTVHRLTNILEHTLH